MRNNKNKHSGGVSRSACNAFIIFMHGMSRHLFWGLTMALAPSPPLKYLGHMKIMCNWWEPVDNH